MTIMSRTALLLTLSIAGPLAAQDEAKPDSPPPIEIPDVVQGITARELGGHMKFLSSDLMRGRDTASSEIRLAAEYIASRLSAAGAEASGDRESGGLGYFQRFPLEVTTALQEGTKLSIEVSEGGSRRVIPLQLGSDVTFYPGGLTPGEIEAPVVFAGYGRVNPDEKVDDYDGIDVKNRFVLVLAGQPPVKPADGEKAEEKPPAPRNRSGQRGGSPGKLEAALKRGALGVFVVQPPGGNAPRRVPSPSAGQTLPGFGRPSMTLGSPTPSIPNFTLSDPIRDLIFEATSFDVEKTPRGPLAGVQASFTFASNKELKEDRNVVGIFPGTDPEKKKEVIVFSAHYDHVGVNDKGEIFNGSDDNASGTSALLEIAEAFGDGPKPARTIAMLWVSGEEKGLLGSQWFADHVSLPEGYKIVADINIDMVSRNDGKSIGMTPSAKHPSHSNLASMAEASAKAEGLEIKYDADQFFGRTDSANFAKKGIPVVFFFSGLHEDYHRPTDDVEKADFDKAARVARAAYRLGWQTAQGPDVPKLSKAEQAEE
ncbi:M20/M25/M40 family metallo-hydrolase [Tundrisphaera lichenicola]|uniref:M20/M25/M40 family metallo-hydrolase n=1 Tax=Tundrisphaera lichenicola TaxID=2029860 RepID=UPI003EB735E3